MKKIILLLSLVALTGIAVFGPVWFEGALLQANDANAAHLSVVKRSLPESYLGRWNSQVLMGQPLYMPLSVTSMFLWALPPAFVVNSIYFLMLLGSCAALMFVFPREILRRSWIMVTGLLAAFWLGSNLTLISAGHQGKYGALLFLSLSLALCRQAPKSWAVSILCGAAFGAMFMQQADVALFFSLIAGPYLVYQLWKSSHLSHSVRIQRLAVAIAVSFLFAAGPLLVGYRQNVKTAAPMQTESAEEKWAYVTQWSFPPEEVIAFIAPGYTGWRSGDPEGPYWGRMGRSAGWEETGKGFRNFKLENTYLGIIPLALALFAVLSVRRSPHRGEIYFWACAGITSLLLSFGKFFPLYALFYQLPVVSSIRNPNKFLQIFQVIVGILAIYGLNRLFQEGRKEDSDREQGLIRWTFYGLCGLAGFFFVWAAGLTMTLGSEAARMAARGWPEETARIIAETKGGALWHALVMMLILAGVFAVFALKKLEKFRRYGPWMAAAVALVVAVDGVMLSRKYISSMPKSYIEANALTKFLEGGLESGRVALVNQSGVYNAMLTFLFPSHGIPTFNYAQMPRMPEDYQQLLAVGGGNPLDLWRFAGVRYVLGPSALAQQVPAGVLNKEFTYAFRPHRDGGYQIDPSPRGDQAVFSLQEFIPRFSLVEPGSSPSNEEVLQSITDPARTMLGQKQLPGEIHVDAMKPGRVDLTLRTEQDAVLRVAERWDEGWSARLNGKKVPVEPIDFICQGIQIPAGEHTVRLRYASSGLFFLMQLAGYLIVVAVAGRMGSQWIRARREP